MYSIEGLSSEEYSRVINCSSRTSRAAKRSWWSSWPSTSRRVPGRRPASWSGAAWPRCSVSATPSSSSTRSTSAMISSRTRTTPRASYPRVCEYRTERESCTIKWFWNFMSAQHHDWFYVTLIFSFSIFLPEPRSAVWVTCMRNLVVWWDVHMKRLFRSLSSRCAMLSLKLALK